jgi:uncharacterized phage protein (TIGR02218 family)
VTFAASEKSVHSGKPRRLYDFILLGGDQAAYYYTDYRSDLSVLGNSYVSAPILRSPYVASDIESPGAMSITMPYSLAVVAEVIVKQPPRSVFVEVREYHTDIGDVQKVWEGPVHAFVVRGRDVEVIIPSALIDALESEIPSVKNQTMCNNVFLDDRCQVVRANVTKSTTVASIDGTDARIVTVTSLDGAADQVYRGGEIERTSDGERRLIVDQTGTVLTLVRAFRNLAGTNAVDVTQGCDHLVGTCETKHDNLINFRGMPYIPAENLFRFGVPR